MVYATSEPAATFLVAMVKTSLWPSLILPDALTVKLGAKKVLIAMFAFVTEAGSEVTAAMIECAF